METTNWYKQTDKPLFEDILWSKPQNRQQAGKLLIIGGNLHGFSAPGQAYGAVIEAGIGSVRVILPDSIKKIVGKLIAEAEYAPSTPSGSFARTALAELLDGSSWSSAVFIAGDLGRNSETSVMLDSFVDKYKGPLTITQDGLDYFLSDPVAILGRPESQVAADMAQLQKMVTNSRVGLTIKHDMGLMMLVDSLQKFSAALPAAIITDYQSNLIVAHRGRISTTKHESKLGLVTKIAAAASVFWLQNPSKQFEACSAAAYLLVQENRKASS